MNKNNDDKNFIIYASTFVVLSVVVAIAFIGLNNNSSEGLSKVRAIEEIQTQYKNNTITKDEAEVVVSATPIRIGNTEGENMFYITLDTHTVELDYDFETIMILSDDMGNIYKAAEWTGNRGWHHVSGEIIFPAIEDGATSLTLMISSINDEDRVFTWSL